MSRGKLVLIVVVVLLVLLWGGYFLFFSATSQDTAAQQLEALKVGDMNAAYALTSQEYQKGTSLAVFQETFGDIFTNYRDRVFSGAISSENVLFVSVQTADGAIEDLQYTMVSEGGGWKVSAMEIVSKASEAYGEDFDAESQ